MSRVVIITDLHIKLEELAFEVDTKANFIKIMKAINEIEMDHLIVAGDLCFQLPELPVYQFVKTYLDKLEAPYSIITGNHDDPKMITDVFHYNEYLDKQENEIYYVKQFKGRPFIFLDTKKGSVSEKQLNWLEERLNLYKTAQPIIIMHYPPLLAGVPHMDNNYSLENREAVLDLLLTFGEPISVFTGHYHVEKTICHQNITQFITPSCFIQIHQDFEEFHPDHETIAYRVIDIEDQMLQTSVHYLWPNN